VEVEEANHLKTLASTAGALLTSFPDASVWALDAGGQCTTMPDSVPLHGQKVIGGRAMIDFVVAQDTVAVAGAFLKCREFGASTAPVRLLMAPNQWMMLHFLDVRETYGVLLAIVVAESVGHADAVAPGHVQTSPSRYATLRETEIGIILGCDEGAVQMFGWTAEEMVGEGALDLIHPDDQPRVLEGWMAMLNSADTQHARVRRRRKDDSWLWIDLSLRNQLEVPGRGYVLVEMIDVSREMAAQEALAAREELLDRLAEALPVGLFQVDVERRVVYSNERLHQILGSEPTEDLARLLATVTPDHRPFLHRALTAVLRGTPESDLEVDLVRPGQTEVRRCLVSSRALSKGTDTVTGAIVCISDITESARMRVQLEERAHELEERTVELEDRATFDMLTRCYNRGSTMAALEEALARQGAGRTGVIFVDIDDFKPVNDRLGHAAGDELLVLVAKLMAGATREQDIVGRIGGDEFVVICRQLGASESIVALGERIAEALDRTVDLTGGATELRASVGIACSEPAMSADTLVAHADEAMYRSKRAGLGRPVLYSDAASGLSGRAARRRSSRSLIHDLAAPAAGPVATGPADGS